VSHFLLDPPARLSRSRLWTLQRQFFETAGVGAWARGVVPYQATNNPVLARAFVDAVLAWTRDFARAALLLRGEALHVVELGAGAGRFGYLFVRTLLSMVEAAALPAPPVRYVLTDFVQANVDAWRRHPRLRPLLARGLLDVARFDVEQDEEIVLMESGLRLGREPRPLVVVANYVFDSLPADAFEVSKGELRELHVALHATRPEPEPLDPSVLSRFAVSHEGRPVRGSHYASQALDRILDAYGARLPSGAFLLPCGAIACVERLRAMAGGEPLVVLAADKGYVDEAQLAGLREPAIAAHGSVSLMVNFHALGLYAEGAGGTALRAPSDPDDLVRFGLAFGLSELPETKLAFATGVSPRDPYEAFAALEPRLLTISLAGLLAVLRLAAWDPVVVLRSIDALRARARDASPAEKRAVRCGLALAMERHFEVEPSDAALRVGELLLDYEAPDEALHVVHDASAEGVASAPLAYLEALCHERVGRFRAALDAAARAVSLDPAHDDARAARLRLEAALR
jgi:hypothetical protein